MKGVFKVALASTVSGLLLAAALPPARFGFLCIVCLVPILAAVRSTRFIVGFLGGLATLSVSSLTILSGVFTPGRHDSGESGWIWTSCITFGCVVALAAGFYADDSQRRRPAWWYAALATAFEAILLLHLPGHLAVTQHGSPVVLLASVGGIWLVSFVLWRGNFALAGGWQKMGWAGRAGTVLVGAAGIVPWRADSDSGDFRVAAVQTEAVSAEELARLQMLASSHSGLVVWPELSGIAFGDVSALADLSSKPGSAPFVTTLPTRAEPLPNNTAILFSQGREQGRYAKRMLFGSEAAGHSPGESAAFAQVGQERIGLNICFDSCFPWIMRDTARLDRVRMIALPNLDPESRHHFLAAVHSAFTTLRAAELGMPIVRAESRAHSMIVNSWGQVVAEAPAGEKIVEGTVDRPHWTPARSVGEGFLYACILGALGYPLASRLRRRGHVRQEPDDQSHERARKDEENDVADD